MCPTGAIPVVPLCYLKPWLDITPLACEQIGNNKYKMSWQNYELVLGRITAAICNNLNQTALLLADVYLGTRDGDDPDNHTHFMRPAMKIVELGTAFNIGGGFQSSPDNPMISAWVEAIDGVIVSMKNITCTSMALKGSLIEHFIAHKDIHKDVQAVEIVSMESNHLHASPYANRLANNGSL